MYMGCVHVPYLCYGRSRTMLKLFIITNLRINAGLCSATPHTLVLLVCVFTQTAVLTAH